MESCRLQVVEKKKLYITILVLLCRLQDFSELDASYMESTALEFEDDYLLLGCQIEDTLFFHLPWFTIPDFPDKSPVFVFYVII